MTQYLITRRPKRGYEDGYTTFAMLLTADNPTAALRKAKEIAPDVFAGDMKPFTKATAKPVQEGWVMRLT